MHFQIDLNALAIRESEKVEWKENGDDKNIVQSIVKTIAAFANDLSNFGGGYVVCGAKEIKDAYGFPKVDFTGLSAEKLREIEGKVLQHCRDYLNPAVVPIVHELENPLDASTRILVFVIIASYDAHIYRDGETSHYYVRIGRETREARNGVLMQLLTKKQKVVPFDRKMNPQASLLDIEVWRLKETLAEGGILTEDASPEDYLSDTNSIAELVPPLFVRNGLDATLRPRNFTLLLFGKKSSIARYYTEAYTIFSIYKGKDRDEPTGERIFLTGSIIEQAKKLLSLLENQIFTLFDKTSSKPNQVKYPIRALKEAAINAIVHRDYEMQHPNRITVFSDRIEIVSMGSIDWGVDKEKFLQGKPNVKWRNQSLAYLFNKLQLAQSEGQGVRTIFRTMREEGCPEPVFEIGVESVTCILYAHKRHQYPH